MIISNIKNLLVKGGFGFWIIDSIIDHTISISKYNILIKSLNPLYQITKIIRPSKKKMVGEYSKY